MPEKSIVRNGNHFIHLGNAGWVLIDGPWFDILPTKLGIMQYHVRAYEPVSVDFFCIDDKPPCPPEFIQRKEIIWEKLHWLTGYKKVIGRPGLDFRYSYFVHRYRYKIGWRVYPDGRLPIFFNALDWQPEMEFDVYLERDNRFA